MPRYLWKLTWGVRDWWNRPCEKNHHLLMIKNSKICTICQQIFCCRYLWLIEKVRSRSTRGISSKVRYVYVLLFRKKAFAYEYTGYLANISFTVKSYFDANIDMLDSHKFYSLFSQIKRFILSKKWRPTYYAIGSKVSNSQFASGSIEGEIERSVIFS